MSRKDTIENMQKIATERGGECLSNFYVDQKTELEWRCHLGHTWFAKPTVIKGSKSKRGTWCPECGRQSNAKKRMHSIEHMFDLAKQRGGQFGSSEYLGSQMNHLWRCSQFPDHPEFSMKPNAVDQGQWCPRCAGNAKKTLNEMNELAKERSASPLARCLSKEYINSTSPLEWSCGVPGHPPFLNSYTYVKNEGSWCPQCRREKPRPRVYGRDFLMRLAHHCGGSLLSEDEYRHNKQIFRWRCVDGHQFQRSLDSILRYRSFCPECSKLTLRADPERS